MCYAIAGAYKGQSAQGMAINGDRAYLFSDGGRCRVLNLLSKKVEREFMLESADSTNHVNNACFGNEMCLNDNTPLLYISECRNGRRCFVECLTDSNSFLLQTIEARKENGKIAPVLDWVVDTENQFLYAITRDAKEQKKTGIIHNYISKYRLPQLNEGEKVVLRVDDRFDYFDVPFLNIIQGAKIRNGRLYIVTGFQQLAYEKNKDAIREILVIDLHKKQLTKRIDLTYVTTNEPEDMDFYKGKALLYAGQNGGLYEVKLK